MVILNPPSKTHTFRDVMPTNEFLLVVGIEPEHIRQNEQTILN